MHSELQSDNFVEGTTRAMARNAIARGAICSYMLFWNKAPAGQREKAKRILREVLAR